MKPVNIIIRTSGMHEPVKPGLDVDRIAELIGASVLSTVNLRDGRVMLLDDLGAAKNLPPNPGATELYHAICKPGTRWEIRGDVCVMNDDDYREADGVWI